jgi:acyl-CoA synthetase (AMP-forming)/AMP-acid ligase II
VRKLASLDSDVVSYVAMPMFHSNCFFMGVGATLAVGGTAVLKRKFSASQEIADIRKYGCTYFKYVGKPVSYILAQPEQPDDADQFDAFLNEQEDPGTKWSPRYIRLSTSLPVTETKKVLKRKLRSERWECEERVFHRPAKGERLCCMSEADREALRASFVARGRESALI